MPANTFSTGRDTQLVIIGPTGRVDLSHVTGFESQQLTHAIRIDRLDGVHMAAELPKGWSGHFEMERGSSVVEDFIASLEQAWFAGGQLPAATLYQYVTEPNGSVSTYQYTGVVFRFSKAGAWKGDASVKQQLDFFASRRQRI